MTDLHQERPPAPTAHACPTCAVAAPPAQEWEYFTDEFEPSYGPSVSADFDQDNEPEPLESPADIPAAPPYTGPLAFVDGTRRAELGLSAQHPSGVRVPGLAGAYAVGAVTSRPGVGMRYEGVRVGRLALWGAGATGSIAAPSGYRWESTPTAATEPGDLLLALQNHMRAAEGELALDACDRGWQVLLDGPLNRITDFPETVCGYVKTHHRPLPADAMALVPHLAVGARTILYAAGPHRVTCYARIGYPRPGGAPLGGIIRLEFAIGAGLTVVAERATALAAALPAYAGRAHRDPRAPANLTPIRNLEKHLAAQLGRVELATRHARAAVVNGALA